MQAEKNMHFPIIYVHISLLNMDFFFPCDSSGACNENSSVCPPSCLPTATTDLSTNLGTGLLIASTPDGCYSDRVQTTQVLHSSGFHSGSSVPEGLQTGVENPETGWGESL